MIRIIECHNCGNKFKLEIEEVKVKFPDILIHQYDIACPKCGKHFVGTIDMSQCDCNA